jgi:hypothetical protein
VPTLIVRAPLPSPSLRNLRQLPSRNNIRLSLEGPYTVGDEIHPALHGEGLEVQLEPDPSPDLQAHDEAPRPAGDGGVVVLADTGAHEGGDSEVVGDDPLGGGRGAADVEVEFDGVERGGVSAGGGPGARFGEMGSLYLRWSWRRWRSTTSMEAGVAAPAPLANLEETEAGGDVS